jgi:tetratricopeptide (TPR) repeat protein
MRSKEIRVGGSEKFEHLNRAAGAFENAILVFTRESSVAKWTSIKRTLAQVYFELTDFKNSTATYAELLSADPNDKNAYQDLGHIYHEIIFDYAAAFELHKNWLAKHPEDISAQTDFAELILLLADLSSAAIK